MRGSAPVSQDKPQSRSLAAGEDPESGRLMGLTAARRSDRASRSARWRSPRYDRYTDLAEIPLLALSVLLIPVLVLPEVAKLGRGERVGLDVVDYGVWAVFIAEYLTRLRLARNRTAFIRGNLLDLALVALPMLRPLRLARATRLVRFALILTRSNRQAQASLQTRAVAYVSVLAATLTLACSVAMLEFERHARGANIRTYGDALWWAVTTAHRSTCTTTPAPATCSPMHPCRASTSPPRPSCSGSECSPSPRARATRLRTDSLTAWAALSH